jgi:transglutaminase-like putative cysteine protease
MKKYIIVLFASLYSFAAVAQDFLYGETTRAQLEMKRYDKDTTAHAVVIAEFGKAKLNVTNADEVRLTFEYHVKIKILDSKAFDKGTISISAYNSGEYSTEIDDISGTTTYIDDNGATKRVDLDPEKIYRVKENKNWTNIKFALPGLRNGCVIEYKYRSTSPFWEDLHPWYFQGDIPKIYSEYDVHIPGFWNYNALIRGPLTFTKKTAEVESGCFISHGASSDCSHLNYVMTSIPAFIEEDYMTSPKNFLSALYFELSDFTNPYTGVKKKYSKEWADVDYDLKHEDYFGGQLKRTSLLKTYITPVIATQTTDLDKAKAIYAFIQKNIKWNKNRSRGSHDGISKALENHTGDAGDINLALVTALNAANINTEAVLLSTRDNGVVNKLYPTENDFDYIVAKVNIADKSYFLDATDPLLPFGMLPLKCLNGEGRVMSLNKPSYWLDIKAEQIRKSTFALDLTLGNDGKIKGTYKRYSTGYDAYEQRRAIKKYNSIDEYLDNLVTRWGKTKILKSEIQNIDSLDMPLIESYEIELNGYKDLNNGLAFNPFIFDRIITNPFKMADRTYPVDWGMPSDKRFILTMHLPDGYSVESDPKKTGVALPNNGGRFVTDFQLSDNMFTFSHVIQFNRSIYSSAEYPYLKELYNRIIQSEKAELVFKKKI